MKITSKKLKNNKHSKQKKEGEVTQEEVFTFEKLRKDAKLSREEVAILMGIKPDTVRKYETSARIPNQKNLSKFQKVLGCTKQDMSKAFAYHALERMYRGREGLDYLLKAQ